MHFTGGKGGGLIETDFFKRRIDASAVTAALEEIYSQRDRIDIVNMSFVTKNNNRDWFEPIKMMQDTVLFVVSAGNDGESVPKQCAESADGVYPAFWSLHLSNVITVGATEPFGKHRAIWKERDEKNKQIVKSSNFGCAVDLAVPGLNVQFTDVTDVNVASSNGAGTSFAAPLVTAAAAMLKAIRPEKTPWDVREHLLANTDQITVCENGTCPGYGEQTWNLLRIDRAVRDWLPNGPAPARPPTHTPTPTRFVYEELEFNLSPAPTPVPILTVTPTHTPTQVPTPTAGPAPFATPVPTASPTPVPTPTPTSVPTRTPRPTPTPTPTPTTPPRVPEAPSGLTQSEYQLLRDVYDCGRRSTAFKWTVISIDLFANLAGYRTSISEEVMDTWDLFLPAFAELLRADPEAAETLSGLLDLFCRQN